MARTVGFFGGKFLPWHLGHGFMSIAASNRVDKLYIVLSCSENRDRELCNRDGIPYIPPELRLSWIGENIGDLENVTIVRVDDDNWSDDYDWGKGAELIRSSIGEEITHVFSSEPDYGEYFAKYYPEAEHVVIDEGRDVVPISATDLRRNLFDHWDMLPNCVRPHFVKRVAVVGTESCGKSVLTKKLASFYNTNFVHEVGRDYCERYANQLTVEMFDDIAMDHLRLQRELARTANRILFVDSEAVVTQYYLDMYFGARSDFVEAAIRKQQFDQLIYLEPDVAWVDDGLRFAGDDSLRAQNNETLKQMYRDREIDFVAVSGSYAERFRRARELVDALGAAGRESRSASE